MSQVRYKIFSVQSASILSMLLRLWLRTFMLAWWLRFQLF